MKYFKTLVLIITCGITFTACQKIIDLEKKSNYVRYSPGQAQMLHNEILYKARVFAQRRSHDNNFIELVFNYELEDPLHRIIVVIYCDIPVKIGRYDLDSLIFYHQNQPPTLLIGYESMLLNTFKLIPIEGFINYLSIDEIKGSWIKGELQMILLQYVPEYPPSHIIPDTIFLRNGTYTARVADAK